MNLAVITSMILNVALWGLLLGFGLWTYRKYHFRSLPWVAAFLTVTLLFAFADNWVFHSFLNSPANFLPSNQGVGYFNANGDLVRGFVYWIHVFSNLSYIILASLILSDIVQLLSNAGVEVKDRFGLVFISLQKKTTPLGIAVLALKTIPTIGFILFAIVR